jgi:competence protein ComEC
MKPLRHTLCALAVGLLLLGVALWLASSPPSTAQAAPLTVTFLDVGQGDCIWIHTPDGQNILVDGGPRGVGADVVTYLWLRKCYALDYMVVTHSDDDHVGGLIEALQYITATQVWHNGQPFTATETYAEFWRAVEPTHPVTVTAQAAGVTFTIGSVSLAVLHPEELVSEPNNNSLVCRLSYDAFDVMLTGDIESSAESKILGRGYPLDAEVLKVAHHGSDSSSDADFLAAVSPETAIISVGPNSYGHPAPEILARLAGLPAKVYRTDMHGTIVVTSDGQWYGVETERAPWFLFLPLVMQ